jgi:hypothetical protein
LVPLGPELLPRAQAAAPRPEAAAPHPRVTVPAGILEKLAGIIERLEVELAALRAALDREARPRPEPLAFRKADAARMCGMSVRLWERLLAAGKAPRPDAYAGKCPLWIRASLERWVAQGGAK